jgi:hypothetical protein
MGEAPADPNASLPFFWMAHFAHGGTEYLAAYNPEATMRLQLLHIFKQEN